MSDVSSATPCCLFLSHVDYVSERRNARNCQSDRALRNSRSWFISCYCLVIPWSIFSFAFAIFVCRVCIQYESFNNFENDTMKLSVNEIKLTGFWARNRSAIQQNFLSGLQSYRDFRETCPGSCLTLRPFIACLVLRCSFYYFPVLSCIYMPQLVFAFLALSCLVIFDSQSWVLVVRKK